MGGSGWGRPHANQQNRWRERRLMKTEHSGRGGKAPGLGLGKHRPPGASPGEAAGPRERGGVALLKHEQGAGVPGRSGGQNQGPGREDRPQAEGAERGGGSRRPHALLTGQRTRQRRRETGVDARGRVPGASRGEAGGGHRSSLCDASKGPKRRRRGRRGEAGGREGPGRSPGGSPARGPGTVAAYLPAGPAQRAQRAAGPARKTPRRPALSRAGSLHPERASSSVSAEDRRRGPPGGQGSAEAGGEAWSHAGCRAPWGGSDADPRRERPVTDAPVPPSTGDRPV